MYAKISLYLVAGALIGLLQGCAEVMVAGGATGVAVAHDQRTAGAVIEDQAIELKVGSAIRGDKELNEQSHINVTSYNGAVLLSGETPGDALRKRAEELASRVEKVKKVHNELAVAAPSSIVSRSSDTLITTKIKSQMVGTKEFDPTRVKVVTENGVVYLMGLVKHAEADVATEIAGHTGGVQRVVKLFEYLE
ncbi:MAG: BON domain-containing protein [Gammaproteobacteria bacterium]|nr:BON domain-containing protein [Gammaproteobacteria bacterium]